MLPILTLEKAPHVFYRVHVSRTERPTKGSQTELEFLLRNHGGPVSRSFVILQNAVLGIAKGRLNERHEMSLKEVYVDLTIHISLS